MKNTTQILTIYIWKQVIHLAEMPKPSAVFKKFLNAGGGGGTEVPNKGGYMLTYGLLKFQ